MLSRDTALVDRIRAAVTRRREDLIGLTQALVRERSLIGEEDGAQRVIAERLVSLGFDLERVGIEPPIDQSDPTWGYPPLVYDGRTCVAGRITGASGGRSLHLSGHVDVVPVDSADRWTHDPWSGEIADGRLWGRGAGDMKAGLAAYLIGTAAFVEVCGEPQGDLLFSSVIEEECTGNGMKAVLAAGYDAEATLIGEPSGLHLWHAGVGVIWARLTARGAGAHAAFSSGEASANRLLAALTGLRELERRLNEHGDGADPDRPPESADSVFFAEHEHPFRLNVGTLAGGAWPSSEPTSAEARIRLGFGLKLTPTQAQRLVSEAVSAATPDVDVTFEGFRAPAYCDHLEHDLAKALSISHAFVHGSAPVRQSLAGTTDARSVHGPCICYGPVAGAIHATDEWVEIQSVEAVASAVALTIAAWQSRPRASFEDGA